MRIDKILNHYDIGDVIETKQMAAGNTSDAVRVVTVNEKYILRKLRDKSQALTEYAISEALKAWNIAPEILTAKNNQPYVQSVEGIYNLQIYLVHEDTKPAIDFKKLGSVVGIFHKKTKNLKGIYEQEDRFSLRDMYNQLLEQESFDSLDQKDKLVQLIEECLAYAHHHNCYIHGDLGVWNMLFNQDDIYLIDFGEVRSGNNHFDIAAVLVLMMDWNHTEEAVLKNLNDFRSGYIGHFPEFDWNILKENFTLWIVRGILAILIEHGVNEKTKDYVINNIGMIERLKEIIDNHVI